jgi:hypothetical protein
LPAAADQIPADDALNRQNIGLLDDHGAAGERVDGLFEPRRDALGADDVCQVVRVAGRQRLQPEARELRQHYAFARHGLVHHYVEGRYAVSGHDHQSLAEVVYIADLTAVNEAGQVGADDGGRGVAHGSFRSTHGSDLRTVSSFTRPGPHAVLIYTRSGSDLHTLARSAAPAQNVAVRSRPESRQYDH